MSTTRPIDPAYTDTDRRAQFARSLLFALFALSGATYFCWRLTVFNPQAPILSLVFYLVEIGGYFGALLLFYVTLKRRRRIPRPSSPGLSVDIFIPTVNEDIKIVRRTLVAAVRIRYPHETWLLDDGNRPAFREMAEELGCRYLSRKTRTGAKAGNLNHGLRHARGDFVALLDADHCAAPDFLDRLLGYFDDPGIAFVQTPQDYYNLNSYQHGRDRRARLIWHEQSGFHHVEQPGRDQLDAATLCGCSCVMRRASLDLIGGFPEETVTEDMHAAVKLQKLGFKTAYHDEPLAFGVAPPDYIGFVRQRLRWGEGNMQVCRAEWLPVSRQLSWRQNLSYLLLGFAYGDTWRKLVLYIAPIVTLLTDIPPVYGDPLVFLAFFLPFLAIGIVTYQELYSGFGHILKTEAYAMARLPAGLGATWGLFRRTIPFRISSKQLVSHSDWWLVAPHATILVVGLYAIVDRVQIHLEQMAGLRSMSLPPAVAFALILLVAYNCCLAFFVLRDAWRSSATNEEDYRFPVPLPVRVHHPSQTFVVWTDLISISAATVDTAAAQPSLAGRTVSIEIFLPSGKISLSADAQAGERQNQLSLQFRWPDLALRDELDQALHAGRWHRVITGRHEMTLSPLERWGWLAPPPTRRPEASLVWQPALFKSAGRAGEQLGYVAARASGNIDEIIAFGPDPGLFEIVASPRDGLVGGAFEAVGRPETALLDEAALDACRGHRHLIVAAQRILPVRKLVVDSVG